MEKITIYNFKKRDRYKLAILTSHPIQYYAPLYKKLASHPMIDLTAYYCADYGVTEKLDPGFGISFKWDTPLLDGYSYKFLKNFSPRPGPTSAFGLINPGILKELFRVNYDAILIQGYTLVTNLIAYIGAWLSDTPVLFRGETVDFSPRQKWTRIIKRPALRFLFARTRAFLTIGSASMRFYKKMGIGEDRLFLTPYCIDNDFFMTKRSQYHTQTHEIKKELGIGSEKIVISFSGKLIPRKRPMDLLQAFEKAFNHEKAALIFIGDGELKGFLADYSRRKHIENVFFLGFKNQSALPRLYAIADILVLPSAFETWGLVINELMCYGIPILTTNMVGSSFDLVHHGENGFVYPPGDVDSLAKYLSFLISNEEIRAMMGRRSLDIISNWNYDACLQSILNALRFVTQDTKEIVDDPSLNAFL